MSSFHTEILDIVQQATGLHRHIAEPMAEAITNKLMEQFGGADKYIPAKDNNLRNEQIRAEFNGRNHAEITARYRISLATLYRITKN